MHRPVGFDGSPRCCHWDDAASDGLPSTEVRFSQIVLNGDGLRLQQLAMGQQHPLFLTALPNADVRYGSVAELSAYVGMVRLVP